MSIISGFNQFINQHFGFNKFRFRKDNNSTTDSAIQALHEQIAGYQETIKQKENEISTIEEEIKKVEKTIAQLEEQQKNGEAGENWLTLWWLQKAGLAQLQDEKNQLRNEIDTAQQSINEINKQLEAIGFDVETNSNASSVLTFLAGKNIKFSGAPENASLLTGVKIDLDGVIDIDHLPEEVQNSTLLSEGIIKQELLPSGIKNILYIYFKTENNITDYSVAYLDNTYSEEQQVEPNATTLYFDEQKTSYMWSSIQNLYIKVMAGEIYSNYFNEEDILVDAHLPVEMVKCYIIAQFEDEDGMQQPPYVKASIAPYEYAPNDIRALYRCGNEYYIYQDGEYHPLVPEVEMPEIPEAPKYLYQEATKTLLFKNITQQGG